VGFFLLNFVASSVLIVKGEDPASGLLHSCQHALSSSETLVVPTALLFSARHPKYECTVCRELEAMFEHMAQLASSATHSRGHFCTMHIDNAHREFIKFGVFSLPTLLILRPGTTPKALREVLVEDQFQFKYSLRWSQLARFIQARMGVKVPLQDRFSPITTQGPKKLLWPSLVGYTVVGLGMLRVCVGRCWPSPEQCWVLALVLFYGALSGVPFQLATDAPMMFHKGMRQVQIFHPSPQYQSGMEGFVISGLWAVAGIGLAGMVHVVPGIRSITKQVVALLLCMVAFFCGYWYDCNIGYCCMLCM